MTWLQGSLRRGRLCRVESQGTDRSAARAIARLPGARATGCPHAPALRWDGCAAGAAADAGDACAGCSGASARSCARGRRAPASWCAVLARAASDPWCDRPRRLGSRASSSNPDSHRAPPRSPPAATRRVAVAALEAGQWERPGPSRRVARSGGRARFWRATPRASIGFAGEGWSLGMTSQSWDAPWREASALHAVRGTMTFFSIQFCAPQWERGGEGNGTSLQYSCLENSMDGGAWKDAVHGVAEGRTRLSDFTFTFHFHALEKGMATHSSVLA